VVAMASAVKADGWAAVVDFRGWWRDLGGEPVVDSEDLAVAWRNARRRGGLGGWKCRRWRGGLEVDGGKPGR